MAGSGCCLSAYARLLVAFLAVVLAGAGCENDSQLDFTPPGQILDLSSSAQTPCSVALTWTASGDDGFAGRASVYDLRYSTSTINMANWEAAVRCESLPAPGAPGTEEHFVVTGLLPDTQYCFKLRALDDSENRSGLSNAARARTLPAGSGPAVAWVKDGLGEADEDWTNSESQLSAAWAPVAGATAYQYSIGTSPGGRDVADWRTTSAGEVTAVTHSSLALASGSTYYFSVRALLEGGCSGYGVSDGVTVDAASPTSHVRAAASHSCSPGFRVVWTGSDGLSGIRDYDVQSKDGTSGAWVDWVSGSADTTAIFAGSNLRTYYFRSRARDIVGNQEAYPDDPDASVSVGPAIPQVATVNDGLGADVAWVNSATEISANWSPVENVQGYEYQEFPRNLIFDLGK